MLTRTLLVADKLGVALFKSSVAFTDLVLAVLGRATAAVYFLLRLLWRVVLFILRPIASLVVALFGLIFGGARRTARAVARTGSATMARRARLAQIEATVLEDPLKGQNRTLSGMIVLLLAALVAVVFWATSQPTQTPPSVAFASLAPLNSANDANALFAATATPATIPTARPSATPLPPALNARGSIVLAARTAGQSDLFALAIGGSTAPIRLTNDPADDRDPAWSPDGQQIAFASRRDGNWELYLYDVTSRSTRRLTNDLAFQGGPSWSTDGQYLVYEGYISGDLGLYVLRTDGDSAPIAVPGGANSAAADYSPAWSPDGRRIAFVSLRDGNPDIYVYSLDDQSLFNLTATADRAEDQPAWSPDGQTIAYSALDAGQMKLFATRLSAPGQAQVINLGAAPAFSPDGASIAGIVETIDGTQIVVNPFLAGGTAAVLPAPPNTVSLAWVGQPLPATLVESGGEAPAREGPLFNETVDRRAGDPPYRLNTLAGVQVEQALLSDQVNDSFNALRRAVNEQVGIDVLGRLDDAFWQIDRPPEPGVPRQGNWLLTGRAFAIQRSGIFGFPPPLEVVREDIGVDTFWRVYVRVSDDAQAGQLGEPLRVFPWDFAARTSGDVEAYDQGGRLKTEIPTGYYVDITSVAADFGWMRAPSARDWRANAETINFWLFEKREGLTWYEAMRELYTDAQLGGFVPTSTPNTGQNIPAPTLEIRPSPIPATQVPTATPLEETAPSPEPPGLEG